MRSSRYEVAININRVFVIAKLHEAGNALQQNLDDAARNHAEQHPIEELKSNNMISTESQGMPGTQFESGRSCVELS